MYGDFEFKKGVPNSKNFDKFELIRMNQTPKVEVHFVKNDFLWKKTAKARQN